MLRNLSGLLGALALVCGCDASRPTSVADANADAVTAVDAAILIDASPVDGSPVDTAFGADSADLVAPLSWGALTHRPRATFDGRDTAHLKRVIERVNDDKAPWSTAYRALRKTLQQDATPFADSGWLAAADQYAALYGSETRNGEIALAKAMVAWLASQGLDPSWLPLPSTPTQSATDWAKQQAQQALQILDGMYERWQCLKGFDVINRGIVAASSLLNHAAAYDLLAALPANWGLNLTIANQRLTKMAGDFAGCFPIIATYRSNHSIRVAAGLGMAAIALDNRDAGWISIVERQLHPTNAASDLVYQGKSGAFAEGTSYYDYAHELALPFAFAYTRYLSGRGERLLDSDLYSELVLWGVYWQLPSGHRPAVDNSRVHRSSTPLYFLSRAVGGARSIADQSLLLWDLERNGFVGFDGRFSGFALAAFDPPTGLSASAPSSSPTRYDALRGGAVLRSGWNSDDAYALVMAQNGEAQRHGGGHEAVQNGSYSFYTKGETITLDPGYRGWSEVTQTNQAQHHSMVLVDDQGPRPPSHELLGWVANGTETQIVSGPRTHTNSDSAAVALKTSYQGATVSRTVVLVQKRYLVVEDLLSASAAHRFSTLIQLNSGGKDGAVKLDAAEVAHYLTPQSAIPTVVACQANVARAPLALNKRKNGSGLAGGDQHFAAICATKGSHNAAQFLTLIATGENGAAPELRELSVEGAQVYYLRDGQRSDVVISNPDRRKIVVGAQSDTTTISTDAELAILSFSQHKGRVLYRVGGASLDF
ncbi:MAG: heparinase II/III family protein [Deltaproteobacteria bacterium]|nr:heparinase II/III family protein [Deltaproteobacteria bacterium]